MWGQPLWLAVWLTLALSGSLSGSLWLSLALSGSLWPSLALSGSVWLALWLSLAPSCSLLLSQALYCSPNLLTKSSFGSQGPCSARSSAAALQHFLLVCLIVIYRNLKQTGFQFLPLALGQELAGQSRLVGILHLSISVQIHYKYSTSMIQIHFKYIKTFHICMVLTLQSAWCLLCM